MLLLLGETLAALRGNSLLVYFGTATKCHSAVQIQYSLLIHMKQTCTACNSVLLTFYAAVVLEEQF